MKCDDADMVYFRILNFICDFEIRWSSVFLIELAISFFERLICFVAFVESVFFVEDAEEVFLACCLTKAEVVLFAV